MDLIWIQPKPSIILNGTCRVTFPFTNNKWGEMILQCQCLFPKCFLFILVVMDWDGERDRQNQHKVRTLPSLTLRVPKGYKDTLYQALTASWKQYPYEFEGHEAWHWPIIKIHAVPCFRKNQRPVMYEAEDPLGAIILFSCLWITDKTSKVIIISLNYN